MSRGSGRRRAALARAPGARAGRPVGSAVRGGAVPGAPARAGMALSPATVERSASSAHRVTSSRVEGRIRPRTLSTRAVSARARSKEPVTCAIAAMYRFPKACPASSCPPAPGAARRPGGAGAVGEAVLEEGGDQGVGVGQGGDALPEVARGQHPQVAPQAPGGAPVVAHRDHRGEVAGVRLEPPQQGGQPGPAPDGHHPRAPREHPLGPQGLPQPGAPGVAPAVGEVGQQQAHEGGRQLPGGQRQQGPPGASSSRTPRSARGTNCRVA